MWILFVVLSFFEFTYASLERVQIENVNLNYQRPYGRGEMEVINMDISSVRPESYPMEIFRGENVFKVSMPFLNLNWLNPWPFIYDVESLLVERGLVSVGKVNHSVESQKVIFTPSDSRPFELKGLSLNCSGSSSANKMEIRLIEDCHKNLDLKISQVEIPLEAFIAQFFQQFSVDFLPENLRPADNVTLAIREGSFSFEAYTKVVFYAGLRAWGGIVFENNYQTAMIRVDQIKFGYLPITKLVMNELAKRIKHPNVLVTGNYIIINFQKTTYEN